MITIDEYVQFIEEMKEIGNLSPDFTIKQYSNGCLLGVNGKIKQFDDAACYIGDYIFWNEQGLAYKLIENWSSDVGITDEDAMIVKVTKKVPWSEMNHPSADKISDDFTKITFEATTADKTTDS